MDGVWLQGSPVASINDLGSSSVPVWKKSAGVVAGRSLSLDTLEHKLLRSLGDPGVHFAVVCASRSCPDIARNSYRAVSLDSMFDQATENFLNNPTKGVRIEGKKYTSQNYLSGTSPIFPHPGVWSHLSETIENCLIVPSL